MHFPVPAGQRLVIEYINAQLTFATTGTIGINVTSGGKSVSYGFPIAAYPGGSSGGVGSHMVRLYADPGSTVIVDTCANGTSTAETAGAISGYLVNIP
jgi:hypothetical protein